MVFLLTLIIIIAIFLVINLTWRNLSRHRKVPCPAWLRWALELENPFTKGYQARPIILGLDLKPGMKVLDVGCGPGRLSIPLAGIVGAGGEVVSIDLQAKMLQIVQKKAAIKKLANLRYLNIPMGEGRLGERDADRAVLAAVLGEVPNRELCLREIHASLKPGGVLAVAETVFDPHYQSRQTVLQLAGGVGFSVAGSMGSKWAYTLYLKKEQCPGPAGTGRPEAGPFADLSPVV